MATITQTLRWGSKGSQVETLQTILNSRVPSNKLPDGKLKVDGIFGSKTYKAVKSFQRLNKKKDGKSLKVDGIVGENTRSVLNQYGATLSTIRLPTTHITGTIPIDPKEISLFRKQLDKEIKRISRDISQQTSIILGCQRMWIDADTEIKKILGFAKAQKLVNAIAENGIITLVTMGFGSAAVGAKIASSVSKVSKGLAGVSSRIAGAGGLSMRAAGVSSRLVRAGVSLSALIAKNPEIAANLVSGVVVPIGAAFSKAMLSQRKFSTNDFISLTQTVAINTLTLGLTKTKGTAVSILGVVYASSMSYMDAEAELIQQKIDIAIRKKITMKRVQNKTPWIWKLTHGLFGDHDKHLYTQYLIYYKYTCEAKMRKRKRNLSEALLRNLRAIQKDDSLIKKIIVAQKKISQTK